MTGYKVYLSVYNMMGQEVEVLTNANLRAGSHNINWDASNYSSGIYFYKLTAGDKVLTEDMALIKYLKFH
ncbi:MAG: T9SS type A sorting domain-containing protein [candidate division Zixibacteria bacterium]|nr:T9SS type A sorting domain-containing protein [candidate division Zixibacteria bacterium]